VIFRTCPDRP